MINTIKTKIGSLLLVKCHNKNIKQDDLKDGELTIIEEKNQT